MKEKIKDVLKYSENKKRLLELEESNKFVFHGSYSDLSMLHPKQGYNLNKNTNVMEKDGDPAVFATNFSEIAIFRSLINKQNIKGPSCSYFGIKKGHLYFAATQNLINAAKNKTGKIYVLNKNKFQPRNNIEVVSYQPVPPIEVVEVDFNDLPQNIEILQH